MIEDYTIEDYTEQWFEEVRNNPSDYGFFQSMYNLLAQDYPTELLPFTVFQHTRLYYQLVEILHNVNRTPFCCFDSDTKGVLGYSHMTRSDFLAEIESDHMYTSNNGLQLTGSQLLERITERFGESFSYTPIPYLEPQLPVQMTEQFFAQFVHNDEVTYDMHDIVSSTPKAYALADRIHQLLLEYYPDTWSYVPTPQKVGWLRELIKGYRVPLYTVSTAHRPVVYMGDITLRKWTERLTSTSDVFEEMVMAKTPKNNQGLRVDVAFEPVTPSYACSLFKEHALDAYNGQVLAQMDAQCFMSDRIVRERFDDVVMLGVACSFDSAVKATEII